LGVPLGAAMLRLLLEVVYHHVAGVRLEYAFPWDSVLWLASIAAAAGTLAVAACVPALRRLPLSVAMERE
jgi:hypothetical protein